MPSGQEGWLAVWGKEKELKEQALNAVGPFICQMTDNPDPLACPLLFAKTASRAPWTGKDVGGRIFQLLGCHLQIAAII